MSTSLSSLSAQQLRRAAAIKEKIQSLEKKLHQMFGATINSELPAVAKRQRRMSASGRARIAAAARARWAKVRAGKASAKPAKKAKRKMSAAGLARIRAAVKARWARVRAAKKK